MSVWRKEGEKRTSKSNKQTTKNLTSHSCSHCIQAEREGTRGERERETHREIQRKSSTAWRKLCCSSIRLSRVAWPLNSEWTKTPQNVFSVHFLPQVGDRSCTHKDTAEKQKTNDHDSS